MNILRDILTRDITKKVLFLILLTLIFLVTKKIFGIFFLTFLFVYLVDNIVEFIMKKLPEKINIKRKYIAVSVYVLFFATITFLLMIYIPIGVREGREIIDKVANHEFNTNDFIFPETAGFFEGIIKEQELVDLKKEVMDKSFILLKMVGKIGMEIFIALLLSIFFIFEKEKIHKFIEKFKYSEIDGVYNFFEDFWNSFLSSFGKIMKAQVIIAIVNTILSLVGLYFLGFPGLVALGIMIMILSLIPVAGVIISLVPLTFIAFSIGGIVKVFWLFAMILGIHIIESYLLNPKIMSKETELPIFITFLVLILSEYLMGVWGLMIGLPLFIFLVDMVKTNSKINFYPEKNQEL